MSQREQLNRFASRETDPVRRWKLSPTDLASPDKDERIVHRPDPHICAPATELFETGEDSGGSFPRVRSAGPGLPGPGRDGAPHRFR